jgi:hypothetical protein
MISNISQIQRIRLVDDDPDSRASYEYTVEDAARVAVADEGPLGTLDQYLDVDLATDAGLCDYELHTHAYANFSGAELVAQWYKRNFPAVLCTRYEKAQIERIRPFRRWIPVLLKPDDLNPDSLMDGYEECIKEMHGKFRPNRRPWRTQVHFLQQDTDTHNTFFVELPGWGGSEILKVRLEDIPAAVKGRIREGFRTHATANIGVEALEDLYLCDWENQ